MAHHRCLIFCQVTADEELVHCCGATSKSGFPMIQASSCTQHPSNTLQLPGKTVYHLTTWYKFMMDNVFPIKRHNQHHLDIWPTHPCFLWLSVWLIRSSPYAWLSNWNVSVKFLPSLQQNFTHTKVAFFKLFHCHFVTNLTNSLCTCSVRRM
jgi:hypothetical protein